MTRSYNEVVHHLVAAIGAKSG